MDQQNTVRTVSILIRAGTAHTINNNYEDPTGADLIKANLTGAKYNENTKFREGFDPREAGMTLVETPLSVNDNTDFISCKSLSKMQTGINKIS